MRSWFILLLFFVSFVSFGQNNISLKKKYYGKYKGKISAYKVQSDKSVLEVGESLIYIDLSEEGMDIKIGNFQMHGSYRVLFKTKTYYLLEGRMDGQTYSERVKVFIKGKTAEREGLYPQPDVELEKI